MNLLVMIVFFDNIRKIFIMSQIKKYAAVSTLDIKNVQKILTHKH